MTSPELFDLVELLINLPEDNLKAGETGTIVECYDSGKYEVEFTNSDGETIALCTLSSEEFIVVWKAKTKNWLPISEQLTNVIAHLSEERQREVFNFARFIAQSQKGS